VDIGGGTTDLTLLTIDEGVYQVGRWCWVVIVIMYFSVYWTNNVFVLSSILFKLFWITKTLAPTSNKVFFYHSQVEATGGHVSLGGANMDLRLMGVVRGKIREGEYLGVVVLCQFLCSLWRFVF
jgi:hypothetical protein